MTYFYCPSLHTFLVKGIHPSIPADSVPITTEEYLSLLEQQAQGRHITFDEVTGKPIAAVTPHDPAQQLEALYKLRVDEINTACEALITAGFWSSALGQPHFYDSQLEDQLNLTGVILGGADSVFACRDEAGSKEFRAHTTAQLRQVSDDFAAFKLPLLQRANALKQLLEKALAAADMPALESINWETML